MVDYIVFGLLFVLGTLALIKLKVKRYFIVFLIKTKQGIRLIDKIAGLSPGLWKFMADFAVVVTFGGLGSAYLSKHGQRKNLFLIQALLGLPLAFLLTLDLFQSALAYIVILLAATSFYKAKSQLIDFAATSSLIYMLASRIITYLIAPGAALNGYLLAAGSVFGIPAIVLIGFSANAAKILSQEPSIPGVSPLLPSSRDGNLGVSFPGYDIFIPWWYALAALIITVVSHELAHGVLARVHNIRVKSTGLITLGILPFGAFVEPDEEGLRRRPSVERMRVFSAGSFANLMVCVFAALFYVGLLFLVAVSMDVDGLIIVGTIEGYPAEGVIAPGTILYEVNGEPVDSTDIFGKSRPGDNVLLSTDMGEYSIKAASSPENESRAYVGIYTQPRIVLKDGIRGLVPVTVGAGTIALFLKSVMFLMSLLKWVMFFNFNIALVNMVPIAPFDGWHMLKELLSAFNISDATAQKIAYGILAFTALLFLVNLSPLGSLMLK